MSCKLRFFPTKYKNACHLNSPVNIYIPELCINLFLTLDDFYFRQIQIRVQMSVIREALRNQKEVVCLIEYKDADVNIRLRCSRDIDNYFIQGIFIEKRNESAYNRSHKSRTEDI